MKKRGRLLVGLVCVLVFMFAFATSAMAATTYGTLTVSGTNFGGEEEQTFAITSDSTTKTLIIGASSRSVTFNFAGNSNIEMYYGSSSTSKPITSYKTTVSDGNTYTFRFKDTVNGTQNVVVFMVKYANTNINKLYLYDDSGNELSYSTSSTNLFKLKNKLDSDVKSVTVNVLPKYEDAVVSINGKEGRSQEVTLESGTTSVEIRVDVEGITSVAYLLLLERADASSSSDATLSSMYVTEGTLSPSFKSTTTSYTCSVPSSASSVALYLTTKSDEATVKVYQEDDLISQEKSTTKISLSSGSNDFRIVVTAPNFTTKTYKLTVNRGGNSSTNPSSGSSNAYLSDLTVKPSTGKASWDESFSKSTYSYDITIPENATYVTVTPELSDSDASVKVAGESLDDGEASSRISVSEGSTKSIKVVVTAEDGDTTKTYTLRVSREGSSEPITNEASDATISTLILKNATTGAAITLSPSFSKNTTSYTVNVGSAVTAVKVKAVPTNSKSTMTVNGVSLASNTDSGTMQLVVGTSAVNVVVTAPDGTKKTYAIKVTRGAGDDDTISLVMKLNSTTITNNGVADKMDAAPYLSNNRTMVPIRFVSQHLGVGEKDIKWDQTTKTATIVYQGKTLSMTLGKTNAAAGLDVAPEIKYNRTMVPLRYISEQLGCTVKWDQATKEITITR